MIDWLNDNDGAAIAIATVVLVVVTAIYAYFTWELAKHTESHIDRAEAERLASADAYRYLIFAEMLRLMMPYKKLLEGWTGSGHRTYPPGSQFPASSDALLKGLAHLHLLTPDEQRGVAAVTGCVATGRYS